MGFNKGLDNRESRVSASRIEQLDLLRRLSCLAFPRANQDIVKTALLVLGLIADHNTGEEIFRVMKKYY